MGKWLGRLYQTDRAGDFDHEKDRHVRARQIYDTIDRQPFQWVVVMVAGIGFFLDGYTLFTSNIALPMIAYVYWGNDISSHRHIWINIATLAGTLVGQVSFGFWGDQKGRKRMYGMELVLLIGSTLGVVMSSEGQHHSMNIFSWLVWWRFMAGVGVGADYPLSAVITSEFAPTKHRARMMATVFFMQPLGQIAGNLVALVVIATTRKSQGEIDVVRAVDIMWRWIIGTGVVPGVLALLFRLAIPETPRFLLDIEDDPVKAEFDATNLFGDNGDLEMETTSIGGRQHSISGDSQMAPISPILSHNIHQHDNRITMTNIDLTNTNRASYSVSTDDALPSLNSNWTISKADITQYFWHEGNWITLLATSLTWALLDFGFYGIGLSNPQFLAKIWGSLNISSPEPIWKTTTDPNISIYSLFMNNSIHALVILNLGSFIGGLLLILCINRIDRVSLQKHTFLFLAVLFISMGSVFMTVHAQGPLAVTLYVIGQIAFNFGPNATTYIIPAEVFPTRYRATCHGISAAGGKLGSILVQIFSTYYKFGTASTDTKMTERYGRILIVFSIAMILGAMITHFFVPTVQVQKSEMKSVERERVNALPIWKRLVRVRKEKNLEVLALGRAGMKSHSLVRQRVGRWYGDL